MTENESIVMMKRLLCHCGGGAKTPHFVGYEGCSREVAIGKYFPHKLQNGNYLVNGYEVSEYTLIHQRLYNNNDGLWTLPKDHSITNSLPDET